MCSNNPKIMVFRPSLSEFQNFSRYIEFMESKGAHKAGVAKIIPPSEWVPRKKSYDTADIMNLKIKNPIYQFVQGDKGIYHQYRQDVKTITVRQFKQLSETDKYKTPEHSSNEELEEIYWKNIVRHNTIYGADVTGSVTDKDVKAWNMNNLDTILDVMNDTTIEGVNTPYLYFGMWKTTFAWHTEDMELYSINYVHVGYPKTWYAISPIHAEKFEKLIREIYPDDSSKCPAYPRHKEIILSPAILKKHSIPFDTITHNAGEFIITFPNGYHSGYNHGYNIAEAINFATPRWVEYGKKTNYCRCFGEPVSFDMELFLQRIQSEKHPLLQKGNDIGFHPECDGSKKTNAKRRKI